MAKLKPCAYCVEKNNHYIQTKVDDFATVETEVVSCGMPRLETRVYLLDSFQDFRVATKIKYCPMCGRRLNNG